METVIIRIAFAVFGICFAAFAILALVQDAAYLGSGEAISINDILSTESQNLDEYIGDYVFADASAVVDLYATTDFSINNIPIQRDNHYIILLDDNSFLSVTLPWRKSSEMNRICEESWEVFSGTSNHFTDTPIHIEGTLDAMTREMEGYFDDRLGQCGVDPSGDEIRHLTINTKNTRFSELIISFVLLLFGVAFLICAFSKKIMNKIEAWDRKRQFRGSRLGDMI